MTTTMNTRTVTTLTGKVVTITERPARKPVPRAIVPADNGYDTNKPRAERLPKGASPDPVLSGADQLQRLLNGQSQWVCQRVVSWVASLASTPKVHTVREFIVTCAVEDGAYASRTVTPDRIADLLKLDDGFSKGGMRPDHSAVDQYPNRVSRTATERIRKNGRA